MFWQNPANSKVKSALKFQSNVYFWNPKDKQPNIGDYLAFETVSYMLNMKDKHPVDIKSGKVLSIGSVLHFAKNNDVIWGTGRNGKVKEALHGFTKLDVRAVRGPLTQKYLRDKGINVPDEFGDPGILAPFIYPKALLNSTYKRQKTTPTLVVPQLNDDLKLYQDYKDQLITPRQMPGSFIASICNAQKVITSSLHGIVLAEAFGIPSVFYNSGSGESMFKYEDYYAGTGRSKFAIGNSIEECLDLNTPLIPDLRDRQQSLIESFPYDRFM